MRWTNILRPFLDIFERLPKMQNWFFWKITTPHSKKFFLNQGQKSAIASKSSLHLVFFWKNYPPALQKPFLKIQRGGPLDVEKKNSSNQVFIKAMLWHSVSRFQNGITLRYWKYFLKIFFQKIGKNIFDTKYLQKIFAIPKCYTILESWDRMP